LPGAASIFSLCATQEGKAEFTLSCDYQVAFGAEVARFLETLSRLLDTPRGNLFDASKDQ